MRKKYKEVIILGLNPNETRMDLIPHLYVYNLNVTVTEAWEEIFFRKWKFYLDAKPRISIEGSSLKVFCSKDELNKHLEYIKKLFDESNEEFSRKT